MRTAKSYLSIASLLLIGLGQAPNVIAAGAAAGGNAGAAAGGAGVSAGGNAGAATTGGNTGVNAGGNAGVNGTGNNSALPTTGVTPQNNPGASPDSINNRQLNQPADARQNTNQPVNSRGNTVSPGAPANDCYTVDGQPTTSTCMPASATPR